jgi:hypothetical protein
MGMKRVDDMYYHLGLIIYPSSNLFISVVIRDLGRIGSSLPKRLFLSSSLFISLALPPSFFLHSSPPPPSFFLALFT